MNRQHTARKSIRIAFSLGAVSLFLGCSPSTKAGTPTQSEDAPTVSSNPPAGAFPAAIGYGAKSRGGDGGRIIAITNLDDSGSGSFRACVEATGPRVCVFRVNGVIRFTTRPPIIRNPYLTIAGQTAPGEGITLSHAGGTEGRTPLVIKDSHDVIVRHIRVRTDRPGGSRGSEDGFLVEKSQRVIFDHVSASWARDELVNGYDDNDDITISNSIFAWGIPRHDKCALLASDPVNPQHLSFIGNICAHNGDRNPDLNFPRNSCVEVINNVLYNAQSRFAEVFEKFGGSPVAIVGNTFRAGPSTPDHAVGIARDTVVSKGQARIYLWGNQFEGKFVPVNTEVAPVLQRQAPCPLTIRPASAESAFDSVLDGAGAYPRDAIDAQVVRDVRNRTGKVGTPPTELPMQKTALPYPDRDRDGMDDEWEARNGTNPKRSDPWSDANGNGISNLEDFLTYREQRLAP